MANALTRRGSLAIWFDPDMVWATEPTGKCGRQPVSSDAAVQTCLEIASVTAEAAQKRQRTASNSSVSPRAFLRTNGRNALDMARDFDREVAAFQVRLAVPNGCTALGIPVTTVAA